MRRSATFFLIVLASLGFSAYAADAWFSPFYATRMIGTRLNLYGVTDTVRPILDEFEVDTGIKVFHLTMKNGEILQRLKNEAASGVVIADLWFTGGADTFINAAAMGLLLPYESENGKALGSDMKDLGHCWYGTSLTLVNWVVNKDLIAKKKLRMPETWSDLLQDGLRGEISMPDPASSGTAYNVVSAILQTKGESAGWAYLDRLIKQVPFFPARGSDPANLVVSGEAVVGINASNGDRDLEIQNPHIKLVYPKDGTGWWPQPVAIVKGTKNEAAAKVFIDWLLSEKGMSTMARTRNAAVVRKGVKTPEGIVDLKDVVLFPTDFQANAADREAILKQWIKHVGK
ncbi:MAG: ABC transporter substrate-binding protein [Treponemataceae bacterium]